MIKIDIKGKIIKGQYAPLGELIVKDDTKGKTGGYYIFVWPNDGTKWPNSNDDMVYDIWLEDYECLKSQFEYEGWKIEWYDEDKKNK
jgi:hypothetical protein